MRLRTRAFRVLFLLCLLPSLALTVLRVIEPDTGLAVRAASFASLGLPGYAVAFALAAFKVAFPGYGRWRLWTVAGFVAGAGMVLHGWWVSPLYLGDPPQPAATSRSFTVMTANLLEGRADSTSLVEEATIAGVDVLVAQEVTGASLARLDRAGLGDALPYRAGTPASGTQGTMVFSSAPLGAETRLDTRFGGWSVTVRRPEGEVVLLAVHPFPALDSAEQWRRDHAVIRQAATDNADLVVGDFNATLDHRPMQALEGVGFRSAVELANAGWEPTWPADGAIWAVGIPLPRVVQIDHVLVGRSLAVVDTHRQPIEGTDHDAVIAELAAR